MIRGTENPKSGRKPHGGNRTRRQWRKVILLRQKKRKRGWERPSVNFSRVTIRPFLRSCAPGAAGKWSGRITGGRDGVLWKNWRQKGLLDIVKPDGWKELDMLDVRPKTVWLCSDCGKMVLDAPKYGYSEGQPKVDMEAYTGGGGFTPDPKAYENYQSQWGTKEEE